jgi:hypothetical protein
MEATNRGSSDGGAPVFLTKPMNGVKRFVGFAGISGNDQYVWHFKGQFTIRKLELGAMEVQIGGELETVLEELREAAAD